jgi:5-formyltetrahydrofolate cyclo-ligase family
VPRPVPRHDRDAGGPADVLAAKAALREQVWAAMSAARVARFPGAAGRIPNFTGAEAAAERLRGLPEWQRAVTLKVNPDLPQLPVRQRALEDGKTVYMAVPRLAEALDFTNQVDYVLIDGDLAVARSRTSGSVTIRATGVVIPEQCRELWAFRRAGGEWKIAQYMFQVLPAR